MATTEQKTEEVQAVEKTDPKEGGRLSKLTRGIVPKMDWAEYSPGFTKFKVSRYVSEFIGTMFLVMSIKLIIGFTSGIDIVEGSSIAMVAPFGIGITLMVLICMFGYISLAQFNPAVTLGFVIRDMASLPRKDFVQWLMYWLSQFAGGIAGGFVAYLIGGKPACIVYTSVHPLAKTYQAFFAEFFYTTLLVSMNIHCASDSRLKDNQIYASAIGGTLTIGILSISKITGAALNPGYQIYASAIGGTLTIGILSISKITGAALNPAVWVGTVASAAACVDHDELNLKHAWIYWIAPICAGIVAGLWFQFIYNFDGAADKFEESMLNNKEAVQLMKGAVSATKSLTKSPWGGMSRNKGRDSNKGSKQNGSYEAVSNKNVDEDDGKVEYEEVVQSGGNRDQTTEIEMET
eukprot:CAMPEP_0201595224 /NCGR_PEP_ID=MMETSP0190_2-20130828/192297_1 /ASSEMBLY_ACC=CAM_ASM_000263 /TAXON_ID=37353 /ORGANISM="Rosalina sp." /LENGTH=405 /DNA_ID=CAMNT_0048055133 /DNA_START=30 /DNA_END=1248 /DNA_ORIENTATION=-